MEITWNTLLSWRMAAWFIIGFAVCWAAWKLTRQVDIMWQRVFLRSAVLALTFTPSFLITAEMLTAFVPGRAPVVPAWYLVVRAVTHQAPGHLICALIPVSIATYLLWVAGMSLHHLIEGDLTEGQSRTDTRPRV